MSFTPGCPHSLNFLPCPDCRRAKAQMENYAAQKDHIDAQICDMVQASNPLRKYA